MREKKIAAIWKKFVQKTFRLSFYFIENITCILLPLLYISYKTSWVQMQCATHKKNGFLRKIILIFYSKIHMIYIVQILMNKSCTQCFNFALSFCL